MFVSSVAAPSESEPAYWFMFQGYQLLVHEEGSGAGLPLLADPIEIGVVAIRRQYLGYLQNEDRRHCYSAELPDAVDAPVGMIFLNLRQLYGLLDETLLWLAGRAFQIVDWDRTHQFCGRCGALTETAVGERAKKCPQCGLSSYPRISPAIIVRVTRNGQNNQEILLARSHRHPAGMYSVLAGFVEPGETLEACVQREIQEEVGIEVKDIRYFGSQPWPFPNSLMIAFTAEYTGGAITLGDNEISDAGWFTADALPQIPPPMSIARSLIDDFVRRALVN